MAELVRGQTASGTTVPLRVGDDGTLTPAPRGSGTTPWQAGVTINNSTANTSLKGAAGAGLRNYLTDLIVSNKHTVAVEIQLRDGSTAIGAPILVPAGATLVLDLIGAIRTTGNTALQVSLDAAVAANVYVTATGFIAA